MSGDLERDDLLAPSIVPQSPCSSSRGTRLVEAGLLLTDAAFISTIQVLSGARAGGLEKRVVVSHLTLFPDRP